MRAARLLRVTLIALAGLSSWPRLRSPSHSAAPDHLPPMASINNPFNAVDFSDLPPVRHIRSKRRCILAYRRYAPERPEVRGSVVLVHGSSASSNSMHVLAKAFAAAGYAAYALDMRGHGAHQPRAESATSGSSRTTSIRSSGWHRSEALHLGRPGGGFVPGRCRQRPARLVSELPAPLALLDGEGAERRPASGGGRCGQLRASSPSPS